MRDVLAAGKDAVDVEIVTYLSAIGPEHADLAFKLSSEKNFDASGRALPSVEDEVLYLSTAIRPSRQC